jgi:MSHA biogenesis protein MshP
MYLKRYQNYISYKGNQGFLLPLAIFIILIAAGLAVIMSKQATQVANSFLLDSFSLQSIHAADTGVELGAYQVLFPSVTRQDTDNRCTSLSINQVFNSESLDQCTVSVSCECFYENNNNCDTTQAGNYDGSLGVNNSFYQLNGRAECGTGFTTARHTRSLQLKYP